MSKRTVTMAARARDRLAVRAAVLHVYIHGMTAEQATWLCTRIRFRGCGGGTVSTTGAELAPALLALAEHGCQFDVTMPGDRTEAVRRRLLDHPPLGAVLVHVLQ